MKKYLALLVLALALISTDTACHPNPANYTVPAGYQTCRSDWDCPENYYCGFVKVDTYAVCKYSPGYSHWQQPQ